MNKKDREQLQKLIDEINKEAKKVVEDYAKNPSQLSGSYHHVHENSPILKTREERLITELEPKKNVDKKK